MQTRIDHLALLSDLGTAALVDRRGAVVWACLPRFDSGACFAALLGDEDNGHWRLAPDGVDDEVLATRRYRCGLVLESTWTTATGSVRVIDFMPPRDDTPDLVRIVEGIEGTVTMRSDLVVRFDHGSIVPWVRHDTNGDLVAIGGPDRLRLHTPIDHHGHDLSSVATFEVTAGDRLPFVLEWQASHLPPSAPIDAEAALTRTEEFWSTWAAEGTYDGAYADDVHASLAVLKGLTSDDTGGIVAAPTTSLPEVIGGGRNWDYRYCWLRDATYTLLALLGTGHLREAEAWRDWLLRAVAGEPSKVQIMYGIGGERRLPESELPWLAGHRGSTPVRVGNAAHDQFQLDVFGEVMDALHMARECGIEVDGDAWDLQRLLVDTVADRWTEPDEGIWEVRGERRHFTHSKLMAWVAVDRAVLAVEDHGLDGPVEEWRTLREEIRADIEANGVDDRGVFTQSYGDAALDASLLLVPLVGFLPADDERVVATTTAIQDELTENGLVLRYRSETGGDGVDDDREGAFLLCSFWLVQTLALQGHLDEATELFERLLDLRNDVGLLSEEVDWNDGSLLGNMPQAFSHLAIVNTAMLLCEHTDDGVQARAARHGTTTAG